MKNMLKLYWMLNEPGQRILYICFYVFGAIGAQLLLTTDFYNDGYVNISSFIYCGEFLLITSTLLYGVMEGRKNANNNHMESCLLQIHNPKELYVKGVVANNLVMMVFYFMLSMVAMTFLIILNGFHIEVVIASLWSVLLACFVSNLTSLCLCNHKKIFGIGLTVLSMGLSILCFIIVVFPSSITEVTSENNAVLNFMTQPHSLITFIPICLFGFVLLYYFGLYCYKTRKEVNNKSRRFKSMFV